jgi:branched-chain amino acid transport system permease protein
MLGLVYAGLVIGLVFVILATGLVLITSVNRILFMAYGVFYTIGAYVTWYVINTANLPYFIALIIGVLCSGLLGIICYLLIFQRLQNIEGGFLATLIASMGLSMLLSQANLLVFGTQSRSIPTVFPGSFTFLGINITIAKLVLIGISILITVLLFWMYEKTSIGRAMRAVSFLPEAATLQGLNSNRIYMLTLGIGTALAGIAGGIIAPTYGMNPQMGNNVIWTVMLMAMLGGMDSLFGAVIGGLVIGQILSFGQFYIGSAVQIVIFVFIGIVLYFKPSGLLGRGIDIGI